MRVPATSHFLRIVAHPPLELAQHPAMMAAGMRGAPMTWPQRLALLVGGLALLGVAMALIRKRRLREHYAVLWVVTAIVLLVLVVMPDSLFSVAGWLDIKQFDLVLILLVLLLAGVAIHFSVVITRQADRERTMSQELALMRDDLLRMRTESREAPPPLPEPKLKPPALRT